MLLRCGSKFAAIGIFIVLATLWTDVMGKDIQGVRVWSTSESTRVVFDLSGNVQYKVFTLENPHRVVLDITEGRFKAKTTLDDLQDTGIKKIRFSQHDPKTLRIVLDMENTTKPSSFILNPQDEYGHRLVIDLGAKSAKKEHKEAKEAKETKVVKAKPFSSSPKLATREFVVAIDAGHGGKDTGAIGGHKSLREKDIVLSVSKRLQGMINAQPGMRAYLIRQGDYFVGLRKRMEIAREQGADLFISVHADSFEDSRASGASVFVLSEKGASNEAARWLAERENRADLVGGISLEDKNEILASVLLDLSQTASQTASYELAGHLIKQLGKVTDLHHKTVQHAGFMVLKSPDIPSVLVELGFLSNPKGEEKLSSQAHQNALATALFSGVKHYVSKRPLPIKHPESFSVARKGSRFKEPKQYRSRA